MSSEDVAKIIDAFRFKTFDQMRLMDVRRKNELRRSIQDGEKMKKEPSSFALEVSRVSPQELGSETAQPLLTQFPGAELKGDEEEDEIETQEGDEEASEVPVHHAGFSDDEASDAVIYYASELRASRIRQEEENNAEDATAQARERRRKRAENAEMAAVEKTTSKEERLQRQRTAKSAIVELLADNESIRFATQDELEYLRMMSQKPETSPALLAAGPVVAEVHDRQADWEGPKKDIESLPWEARVAVKILCVKPARVLNPDMEELVLASEWFLGEGRKDFVNNAINRETGRMRTVAQSDLEKVISYESGWARKLIGMRQSTADNFMKRAAEDIETFYASRKAESPAGSKGGSRRSLQVKEPGPVLADFPTAADLLKEAANGNAQKLKMVENRLRYAIKDPAVVAQIIEHLRDDNEINSEKELIDLGVSREAIPRVLAKLNESSGGPAAQRPLLVAN
jgi:hypothetical protein